MSQTLGKSETAPMSQSAAPATAPQGSNDELSQPVKRSLFLYSGFNKLFIGSLFGTMADRLYQMSLIAAANIIFTGGESVRQIVHIQIVATLPGLLLYAASGSLVDTYDRRRLMMMIKATKVVAVLLFVPLLWNAAHVLESEAIKEQMQHSWIWCLGVVVLLNIISVPFSPSRAAAIPDVAPPEHRSLGASLMATTGLISFLVGPALGAILARGDVLGPAKTIIVVSIFYACAAWLFAMLPDAVAVPGNKREKTPETTTVEEKTTFKSYMVGLYEGLVYCLKHWSVLGLIFFETMFWTFGSAFYVLFLFHAGTALHFEGDAKTTFFGIGLGCAGIGLFGGAIGVGKIANRSSPLMTYPLAFLLIGGGLRFFFQSTPVDGHAPYWIYPDLFGLGLGGGLLLGRVDADVLATTEASIRGRVFSLKAMCFAATTLATMLFITEAGLSDDQLRELALWLPRVMFISVPIAIIFSWLVDIAIWSKKADMELPGPFHRFGYRICRIILRTLAGTLFRFRIEGAENIPKEGPVVLAANHGSYADPPLLGCGIERLVQYIIYSSYYRTFAHPLFRFLRCIPVDEHDHLGALKATVRSLNQGACIGIFPEGRITYDGKMNPPQQGALFVAQRSGAMVVPVAIKGNFDAWPRTKILPHFRKPITIIYGKPFPVPRELTKKEVADLTDKMMAEIADKLELPPPPKSGEAPLESSTTPPKE